MNLVLEKYLNNYEHIIWDFNGTILNDIDLCFSVLNFQLQNHGLLMITKKEYLEKFCFPISDYYQKLGFDYKKVPFSKVIKEFTINYLKRLNEANLFDGVTDLLKQISQKGIVQSILSAAKHDHLLNELKRLKIGHFFNYVYGLPNYNAASKLQIGYKLMKKLKLKKQKILLIGDTDHDLKVGSSLGVDVLLIADGHQNYCRLQRIHYKVLPSRYF